MKKDDPVEMETSFLLLVHHWKHLD